MKLPGGAQFVKPVGQRGTGRAQTAARHTSPVLQLAPVQHGPPSAPQGIAPGHVVVEYAHSPETQQ